MINNGILNVYQSISSRLERINRRSVFLILMGAGIAFSLIFHYETLTQYPTVFIDESWNANAAWNWVQTGVNFDPIHSGTLDQKGYEWLRRSNIGTLPWVIAFSVGGLGLFQARMVSYLFGVLLLAAVIFAGRKAFRLETGVLAALFVSLSAPFLTSAHYARQEIFLVAVMMFLFAFSIWAFEHSRWWPHFILGLGLGMSTDIHQNAILFFLGFLVLYVSVYRFQVLRRREFWLWVGGVLVGVMYFLAVHILPNPSAYFFYLSLSTDNSYAPPILSMNIGTILQSARGELQRFHFYENSLDFALLVASGVFIALRRQRYNWAYLGFVVATFASFTMIQASKVYFYDILVYTFFLMLVAETLASLLFEVQATSLQRIFILCLTVAFIFNGARHMTRIANENRGYDYYALTNAIDSVLQPDDRILAVPTWWLGLTDTDFKSAYMLPQYYFFNRLSFEEAVQRISPTVLIVDEGFWNLFVNSEIPTSERTRTIPLSDVRPFFDCCTEELLVIPSPQHGNIIVYRVINTEWTK